MLVSITAAAGLSAANAATATTTAAAATATATATAVTVDGTQGGRTFDGIGAISGGGANSRLLTDYPEPQRGQILDYLFKPGYGAALQILKVEIGGDTNSTDGSESSHEHYKGDLDCNRGYEWWLMEQAKERNPNIKLYGLAWGAPGWLGGGNYWSQDTVNYLMDWLGCAKQHGLTIDYLGGWNEKGYNVGFYESLHAAIAAHGYHTQVVGADSGWDIADAMVSDPAFAASVDIIGTHYPCGYLSAMTSCSTTPNALATGKQLWASENGSEGYNTGGAPMARAINRGYLDAKMTAFINWPLIASVYPNLPYNNAGLMVANQPWSGYYSVGEQLWATAQTTQFTQPGWHYIDSASGYLGGDRSNGSYVTLQSPGHKAWSTIVETLDATAPQTLTFNVTGGLPGGAVHVWSSDFSSARSSDYMVHDANLTPSGGTYSMTLQPGRVYSLTTTTGQGHGTAMSPPQAQLTLPQADNFDSTPIGQQPRYLSQQQGAFEAAACAGGRAGRCVMQSAPQAPITWDSPANPYTLIGDLGWQNYTVAADVLLEQAGSADLMGRVGSQRGFNVSGINAYYLRMSDTGTWSILKNTTSGTFTTLATGTTTAPGTGTWHRLALSFQGNVITAVMDGHPLGTATDSSYSAGMAGLAVDGYQTDQFDNLSITPLGTQAVTALTGPVYKLVNRTTGNVLAVAGGAATDGAPVVQASDDSSAGEQWRLLANRTGAMTLVNTASGKVLTAPSGPPGTGLDQSTATGANNQRWRVTPNADGSAYVLTNAATAMTADARASTPGSPVVQWPDNRQQNEQWQIVQVPGIQAGTYHVTNSNSGLDLDVSGGSTADGALIVQEPDQGHADTQWTFTPVGGGYWTITDSSSGLLLADPGASTTEGVQLQQHAADGSAAEQWQLSENPDGTYTLVNRTSGMDVDVSGQSIAPGGIVIQWPDNGGANQHWDLVAG